MILIYTQNITPRITYTLRQVCTKILGYPITITSKIEDFIAHEGIKFSYGKQRLGNEFFVQESGLLHEQGYTDIEVKVAEWEDTICFFKVSEASDLPFDIFSASFYMLSRYEEYLPHVKNANNSFPYQESLAYKNDFLEQPVVNIWAKKFVALLEKKFELTHDFQRKFRVNNILVVAEGYKYKKKGIVRTVGGIFKSLLSLDLPSVIERIKVIVFLQRDPYDVYDQLVEFSKKFHFKWMSFFQLSNYSLYNKNLNHNKMTYHYLIKSMDDYGNVGLLPGKDALEEVEVLRQEKRRFEAIVNQPLKNICSNSFDINLPQFYNHLDELEISQDYSMCFPEIIGFRAGTCTSFSYYDITYERVSPLTLHPIVFNSNAIENYTYYELKNNLLKIREQVKKHHGDFSMIIKNSDFCDWLKNEKYLNLFIQLNEK
ncbi:hypothetical protein [Mesonia sp. K7]|uniref:DUF7033 domain-containing protein n=1 Tax=Mesonia sp. K7 TaxID=2218606 RepID=UPI000DAA2453|nr:hypothetical protein [Mesonia sp. K7]PZD76996.1 hypothetical protein DNG35_10150 [Mesonia sp. K7]